MHSCMYATERSIIIGLFSASFHDTDINECELYDYNRYCEHYYYYYYYHYGFTPKICNNTVGSFECVCPPGYILCDESYECIRKLRRLPV